MLKVRVPEDTAPWKDILQVGAQDADANSKLVFSIHSRQEDSSKLFHLDPRSGVLVLKEELDYEAAAVHTLVVMVDGQQGGGTCFSGIGKHLMFPQEPFSHNCCSKNQS